MLETGCREGQDYHSIFYTYPFTPTPPYPLTMNLFGKAKSKTSAKDAIYKLRETLDMLEKRQAFLEAKANNELKTAKANATKNRRGKLKHKRALYVRKLIRC